MTTVHAGSPATAIEQLVMLVLQRGTRLGSPDVRHYVLSSIDLFVQLSRSGGQRRVDSVMLSQSLNAGSDLS